MPKIDQLVDATVGHPRMSFLDAFQGYYQIPLALDDQEKTAFVTPIGNYHYKVMPLGLKNAGSTYQRMMTRIFELQLGKNIEIYINDIVVKSKMVSEHLGDLRAIFEILRKYKLHLNASKCYLAQGRANSWVTWSLTEGLKLTLIGLKLLTTCDLLGIPRKCRN